MAVTNSGSGQRMSSSITGWLCYYMEVSTRISGIKRSSAQSTQLRAFSSGIQFHTSEHMHLYCGASSPCNGRVIIYVKFFSLKVSIRTIRTSYSPLRSINEDSEYPRPGHTVQLRNSRHGKLPDPLGVALVIDAATRADYSKNSRK